ncbi:MAG: hypothetical protein WC860_01580 [Candidatus Margulisiibacteriota bacterium]
MITPNITIQSIKLKSLLTLAKFSWLKFTLNFEFEDKNYSVPLKFLDIERKIGLSSINELILEAPSADLIDVLKKTKSKINFKFIYQSEHYYFSSTYLDTFDLIPDLKVISFKLPEEIYKKSKRTATRTKNNLEQKLEDKSFYLRDLSINGFSIVTQNEEKNLINQRDKKKFSIPLIRRKQDQVYFLINKLNLNYEFVRKQKNKNNQIILGATFLNLKPFQILIIKEYLKIRAKEEDFFSKNQYYPKVILPAIDIE